MSEASGSGPELHRVKTGQSITKAGEFGFPQGHLGHLTADQEVALEHFKELAVKDGQYTAAVGDKPASHDDVTMLRFLRARRFVPADALKQFHDTQVWRKQNHISALYENIDVNDYEETRKLYPQWTGRRDKRGIPVYVFEVAPLNSKTMGEYNKSAETTKVLNVPMGDGKKKSGEAADVPPRLLRLFALYENLTNFVMPLCTKLTDRPNSDTPISQSNNIVDISKVGLKQFWNLRGHMQDASQLATAHYPETLDRIFIVGAPSFFPTVWSWIKRWFDPITVSKIFILTEASAFQTLSSFIEPENIPTKYGGKLDWSWGEKPLLDVEEAQHLKFAPGYGGKLDEEAGGEGARRAGWPKGPLRWKQQSDLEWQLEAVGSQEDKERREIIGTLNFSDLATTRSHTASRQQSRQVSRPATGVAANASMADSKGAADATAAAGGTDPAKAAAEGGLAAGVATAGIANLTIKTGDEATAATAATTEKGVTETAPIPPQPMITPDTPLPAVATDLPAETPGEVQKELGTKPAAVAGAAQNGTA